ncbi:MAG TPA: ferrous iron transport protein B [Gammaproteobacteria bacterium]|nr:ferrous iron transport protein B [Gammaproteobacteria bacterium]
MRRIALVGMPNTGKSTFFNRLTGAATRTGNWPGVTVDLRSAKILLGAEMVEVVDLPGIYDLQGYSEDEHVVRDFLTHNAVDLVCLVLNATQLDHQLGLALQFSQLEVDSLILLNMADEAKQLGLHIDTDTLTKALGREVRLLSARRGDGFRETKAAIEHHLASATAVQIGAAVGEFGIIDALSGEVQALYERSVQAPAIMTPRLTERIDRVLLHPWLGLPLFFLFMFLVFQAIYALGTPLQDGVAWALDGFRQIVLEPLEPHVPHLVYGLLVDGIYDGVGTVASFVPVIILFFFMMSLVEDSGYLSRAAFLMDALMARLGLDGRGFVMLLMGFGCNVPALMGTRVMRSRALRLLTMLVIPFSLCSARLQVFVFMTTALFTPRQAPLVLFSLYVVSFLAVLLSALLVKRRLVSHEPFVLELPPYRLPQLRQVFYRGWHEVRHFLHRASKFIIAGVVLVWLLTHYPVANPPGGPDSFAGMLGQFLQPVLSPIGISAQMAVVLVFGFVAKEIVLGSLVAMTGLQGAALSGYLAGHMSWVEGYSLMLFILLYTPCLSTVATMRTESHSLRYTAFSIVWALTIAWVFSFVFYQGASALL